MAFSSTTKYNYIDVVNRMVPDMYRETDFALFGEEEDISLTFLGKLLKAAIQNNLLFDVSTLDTSTAAQWFVPNEQTHITPNTFQGKILTPYGLSFDDFASKTEFKEWFSGIFLPDSVVNNPAGFFAEVSAYGFGFASSLGLTHQYLIDTLGLFYFMNDASLAGGAVSSNASSVMVDYIVDPIFAGKTVTTKDGLNALFRFFWENRGNSSYYASFFPPTHVSSTAELSANQYLSGTQMWDAIQVQLQTWTDDRIKNSQFYKDSLSTLLDGGSFPTRLRDAGPFQRFLKAISLGIADINLIIEEISDLLSIDDCPEQFMELLANNIGWQFLTGDYGKWRAQLRNAVMVYKTKGSVVGFDAVCKLVFPQGTFAASDIGEAWESYLPKLLYYLVKTESFIANENLEFNNVDELFYGSWPQGVRFNQAPSNYQNAKDRNYRFLVDGILEEWDNQFSGLTISGRPYKELPMWTCLPGTGDDKGFLHRNYPTDQRQEIGFKTVVPPWEKYGFYTECELSTDSLEYFCNVLSGDRSNFGFEVDSTYVAGFKTLVTEALTTIYELTGTPTMAENNKFRFFNETHQLPPNYAKYVSYGDTGELALLDLWNTKSSFVFGAFNASSLDYTVDAFDTFRNRAALQTFVDVMRTFVPLHVVARILLYTDLEDTHGPTQKLCVISDECLDDFNTGYLNSNRSNFWAGASGGGNLSSTIVNGDGRVLPNYVSGITPPSSMFWQVSATNLDRNTSRRRNYRYALDCYPYTRPGTSMPIALNHYAVATSGATLDEYMNTWEYIIKGFEYDTQTFAPPSSIVWDNSGWFSGDGSCFDDTSESGDFNLSALYPVRAVPDDVMHCSSVVIYRDNMKGILEVMTDRSIREEGSKVEFSDLDYRSYKFGDGVHANYSIYKNEFSSVLKDTLSPNIPYYGGHNFISYAYGPTVWNSDFRYAGAISTNAGSPGPELPGTGNIAYGYEAQWSSVVGGTESGGIKYHNINGTPLTISNRPYFANAPDAVAYSSVSGVWRTPNDQITNEIVSGIQIRQPWVNSKSFLVVNSPDGSLTNGSVLTQSVSLFNIDGKSLQVVVPFDPSLSAENQFNKLRPQSQFRLDFNAITQRHLESQDIAVQLITSGLLDDDGASKEWSFCWRDEKWIPSDTLDDHVFTKTLRVEASEECPVTVTAPFHTQDIFTVKSTPCGAVFRTADVHTSSTGYLLKVSNNTTVPVINGTTSDGLVLNEISIVDTVLNSKMNGFNSSECDIIYTFWDGLSVGAYSRDKTYSEAAFDTSGGSKAEYLELLGGPDYSTSGSILGGVYVYFGFEVSD